MKPNASNSTSSRRQLLRTGAAVLGAAALGSPLPANSVNPAPGVHALPLTGKVALVTGAGRGIGRGIAVGLAQAGADVVCLDICTDIEGHPYPMASTADLDETVRQVKAAGRRAHFAKADIRDYNQLTKAVAAAERALGPLDVVAANAGIDRVTSLIDKPEDESAWRDVMEVNVLGTANTLRAVLPGMAKRGRGSVFATASTFGRSGAPENPSYAASKWAIVGLVKSAALQAGEHGVRVNAIAPTGVVSQLRGVIGADARKQYDTFFEEQYHALPVGMLLPEDIAGTAVYLASDMSARVSGAVIDVAAGANANYTG